MLLYSDGNLINKLWTRTLKPKFTSRGFELKKEECGVDLAHYASQTMTTNLERSPEYTVDLFLFIHIISVGPETGLPKH
jgi:hypothetical protein